MERRGIPTVTFVGNRFEVLANYERQALGLPDLHLVILPYPFGGTPPEVACERAVNAFDQVVAGLCGITASGTSEGRRPG